MTNVEIIAENHQDTVVTEYQPNTKRSESYQSESELEEEFIKILCSQGYSRISIHSEKELIANLRTQIEELNKYKFSDGEWNRFFKTSIASSKDGKDGIVDRTRKIQEDNVQVLERDNGMSQNIMLIEKISITIDFKLSINSRLENPKAQLKIIDTMSRFW